MVLGSKVDAGVIVPGPEVDVGGVVEFRVVARLTFNIVWPRRRDVRFKREAKATSIRVRRDRSAMVLERRNTALGEDNLAAGNVRED